MMKVLLPILCILVLCEIVSGQAPAPVDRKVWSFADIKARLIDLEGKVVMLSTTLDDRQARQESAEIWRAWVNDSPRELGGFVYFDRAGLKALGLDDGSANAALRCYVVIQEGKVCAIGRRLNKALDGSVKGYSW